MDIPLHDDLQGQVAFVTGANRGIGSAVTLALAELGCTVWAGARDATHLDGIEDESDGRIRPVMLDVTDEASIEAAMQGIGSLDIVVNNAGIGDWHGSVLHTLDAGLLDKVLATNLRGPMLLAKHAIPKLVQARGGRIVNVSSGMGALEGMGGGSPAYRVSKTGLNGLTTYLAGEYGPRGLIANSVCPGWVRTDMGGENAPRDLATGADGIVWLCRFKDGAPNGYFWRDRRRIAW